MRNGTSRAACRTRFSDGAAGLLITLGGTGTIAAVLFVALFLVWVAAPLFLPAEVSYVGDVPLHTAAEKGGPLKEGPLRVGVDPNGVLGWLLARDGTLRVFDLEEGKTLARSSLFEGKAPACAAFPVQGDRAAFGFSDGTVQLLRWDYPTRYLEPDAVPRTVRSVLEAGRRTVPFEEGMMERTPEGQFRVSSLRVERVCTERIAEAPVRRVALVQTTEKTLLCAVTEKDHTPRLLILAGTEKEDFFTGEKVFAFGSPEELPWPAPGRSAPPFMAISGTGRDVFLAWGDGWLARVHRGEGEAITAETGRLTPPGEGLTAFGFILGETTLVWGERSGRVEAGFLVPRDAPITGRGRTLERAKRDSRSRRIFAVTKELAGGSRPVTLLAPSPRSRLLLCGYADGSLRLFHVTSERTLGTLTLPEGGPVRAAAPAPKEDGFLAVGATRVFHYALDPRHPEAGLKALFLPVWYEGFGRPLFQWQSTGGTDDFEPKFSLVPLVFGTIKATFYAMLFAVPLALLAALYTSEFLGRKTRAVMKPAVEMMASLPSVVLGFLAAMVIAPFVSGVVSQVLALFFTLPFALLLGAHLWQCLPEGFALRFARWRILLFPTALGSAVVLAACAGPCMERWFFGGDLKAWLAWNPDGETGPYAGSAGGWFLLLLYPVLFITLLTAGRWSARLLHRRAEERGTGVPGGAALLRFAVLLFFSVGVALAVAFLLDGLGMDPRGKASFLFMNAAPLGTYVQRNALVVGVAMGFAVIPIIYTLAEDALSAVPDHLRSASLAAGATSWQTLVRIVIPAAASGLFSALMIGLGRAVGETMIVLMALGNTPVMDWNLFNGARTLSANIAVELPEAVRDSTHYRTLFFSALVLFAMTFVVNTAAEAVRIRFRRRARLL